jgi:uncharacterized LabA/DUF88 family protein
MADRVVVFIDYQNLYRSARSTFHHHESGPHWCGQVDPLALAAHLAADSPFDRTLDHVRVYRGVPANKRDPRGYAAARRQISVWAREQRVNVISRPLQYPAGWPNSSLPGERPREKGIDVALAMDFAVMSSRGEYDVGIMCSPATQTSSHPWSSSQI